MGHLWTPWRFQYVSSDRSREGCVFCGLVAESGDEQNFILRRGSHNFVILNRFPYTAGHLMIVANRHAPTLCALAREELGEMMELAQRSERALQNLYSPHGLNMGWNIGRSVGAGVDGHLHLHVVPRWQGDTNSLSVVGETRVIPEDLADTYGKLKPHSF